MDADAAHAAAPKRMQPASAARITSRPAELAGGRGAMPYTTIDASAIATPIQIGPVSAPVQIKNAGGNGIGSHGRTTSASGVTAIAARRASRRPTAYTRIPTRTE